MSETTVYLSSMPDDFFDHPHVIKRDPRAGKVNADYARREPGRREKGVSPLEGLEVAERFDPYARDMARAAEIRKTAEMLARRIDKWVPRYFAVKDRVRDAKERIVAFHERQIQPHLDLRKAQKKTK